MRGLELNAAGLPVAEPEIETSEIPCGDGLPTCAPFVVDGQATVQVPVVEHPRARNGIARQR